MIRTKDFMTSLLVTAEADTPVVEAARLMAAEEIGSLVVTRNEVLVGLVTEREVIGAQLLSDDVYRNLKLDDIMISPVVTIGREADLGQTISLMDQSGTKYVLVVQGDDMVGIVAASDIIRILARMKLIVDGADKDDD